MAYFPGPINATSRNTLYKTQHYNCAEIWTYHRYSRIHRCNIWYITFDMSLFTVQPTLSRSHKVRSWIHFMYILRTCYGRLNGVSYRTGFFRNFLGLFGFLLHSLRQKLCPNKSSCSNWVKRLPPSKSPISPPSSLENEVNVSPWGCHNMNMNGFRIAGPLFRESVCQRQVPPKMGNLWCLQILWTICTSYGIIVVVDIFNVKFRIAWIFEIPQSRCTTFSFKVAGTQTVDNF